MVKVPYKKRERPVVPVVPEEEGVPGVDIPWCDGVRERGIKRLLVRALEENIKLSIYLIKRLQAPVKAPDMAEIQEEPPKAIPAT